MPLTSWHIRGFEEAAAYKERGTETRCLSASCSSPECPTAAFPRPSTAGQESRTLCSTRRHPRAEVRASVSASALHASSRQAVDVERVLDLAIEIEIVLRRLRRNRRRWWFVRRNPHVPVP